MAASRRVPTTSRRPYRAPRTPARWRCSRGREEITRRNLLVPGTAGPRARLPCSCAGPARRPLQPDRAGPPEPRFDPPWSIPFPMDEFREVDFDAPVAPELFGRLLD